MSKTTPVRWWRDDETRYQSRPPYRSPPYDGPMFDYPPAPLLSPSPQWLAELQACAEREGIQTVIPRDSLKLREPPPDPWDEFARRQLERINRGTVGS